MVRGVNFNNYFEVSMRYAIIIIILVFTFFSKLTAQDLEQIKIEHKIQKLEKEKTDLESSLHKLNSKIINLKKKLKTIQLSKIKISNDFVKAKYKAKMRLKPDVFKAPITYIQKGASVLILDIEGSFMKVMYHDTLGYVWKDDFEKSKFEDAYIAKKKESEKQLKILEKKDKNEKVKKIKLEKKKKRIEKMVKKYGNIIGKTIANWKISIGMTKEMVIDAWGKPKDINKTITNYGTREQWVYGLSSYVYFENGKVITIQN